MGMGADRRGRGGRAGVGRDRDSAPASGHIPWRRVRASSSSATRSTAAARSSAAAV